MTRSTPLLARAALAAIVFALTACGGGGGGGGGTQPVASAPPAVTVPPGNPGDQPLADPTAYSVAANANLASATESAAISHHSITLNGTAIAYTATAGHLTASDLATGAPSASIFYIAYTADNQPAASRPVMFFYNGGPGSSTVWLHLGSFAPQRLVTGDPSNTPAMPFAQVDNAESLIDTTDLVFIDAVGTGLSEAIAPNSNQTLWGVDADARVFRDFVRRYLAVNQRTASPKFLFGESYGTTRSAVLASVLQAAGVALNGVILQSSILNYNSNCGINDLSTISCAGYVPSYGAIGAYYGKAVPAPTDLPTFVAQVRSFTASTYAPLENMYLTAPAVPPAPVTSQLQAYSGISQALWQLRFDLDPTTFQYNLVPNILIGRYDARVNAALGSSLAAQGDPSSTIITDQFSAAISAYLPAFLKYQSATGYTIESNAINTWNFSHDGLSLPDVVPDLATAMAQNPTLKILSLNGYHDLATPFYQSELDLARLPSQANVTITHYTGGHMIYLDDGSRPLEKADVVAFIHSAI